MDSPAYITLSAKAVRLLLEFARQYNGFNNGALCAAWRLMQPRGWNSRDTLRQALVELLEHDLILLTRQGGKHKASLYALTWKAIDDCRGKLDVSPTRTPPGNWQSWSEQNLKPAGRVCVARQSGQPAPQVGNQGEDWPASRVSHPGLESSIGPPGVDLSKLPGGEGLDTLLSRYGHFEILIDGRAKCPEAAVSKC